MDKGRRGLGQGKAHPEIPQLFNFHALKVGRVAATGLRIGDNLGVGKNHVVGGKGAAIVPAHIPAQIEGVNPAIGDAPARGQGRFDLVVGQVVLDQAVEHLVGQVLDGRVNCTVVKKGLRCAGQRQGEAPPSFAGCHTQAGIGRQYLGLSIAQTQSQQNHSYKPNTSFHLYSSIWCLSPGAPHALVRLKYTSGVIGIQVV
ncbi:hypothetical protein Mcate_01784 [Meiothermus taiwanensis]|uniref:Uncharacterized protein n=1 Tax=Meiothermus taiwanensis TaxID=172827 RepID=A0A399DXY4_9DEIN|nr:hypothetical protein Mcate_01784 [Meiothermus taiwanensis]